MDQYQQQQHIAALMASMGVFFFLIVLVFAIFFIFCFWRIFTKAGMAGPLALLVLIPGIGSLIVVCILAFARWNVVPAPPQYGALPPSYPPPYPPAPPNQV
jgi:heme/copper-type cytochrome/quinol oxidase subunit 2